MDFAKLNREFLELPNKSIPIREITKLKCLGDEAFHQHRQLKVTHNMVEDVFFAAEIEREEMGFPLQYLWFAKIINAKF